MSQYILHAYPIWDSLVTLKKYVTFNSQSTSPSTPSTTPTDSDNTVATNAANEKMTHWLTFWILSFGINNLPLPDVAQWVLTSLLFLPSSTTKVRNVS